LPIAILKTSLSLSGYGHDPIVVVMNDCDDGGEQVSVSHSIEFMSLTADEAFVQLLKQ